MFNNNTRSQWFITGKSAEDLAKKLLRFNIAMAEDYQMTLIMVENSVWHGWFEIGAKRLDKAINILKRLEDNGTTTKKTAKNSKRPAKVRVQEDS